MVGVLLVHYLLLVALAAVPLALSESVPRLLWLSHPVLPGETVQISGAFLPSDASELQIELQSLPPLDPKHGAITTAIVGQSSVSSGKFTFPTSLPFGAYWVRVRSKAHDHGAWSEPLLLNGPDPWWVQGDHGRYATPGGWIRVLGRSLSLKARSGPPREAQKRREQLEVLEKAMSSKRFQDALNILQTLQEDAQQQQHFVEYSNPTLLALKRVSSIDSPSESIGLSETALKPDYVLAATKASLTLYNAHFQLPSHIDVASYRIWISTSGGSYYVPLESFISPSQPRVSGIEVRDPIDWREHHRVVVERPTRLFPMCMENNPKADFEDSHPAVVKAMQKASDGGGGVVFFRRGYYYLSKALEVPANVTLQGEGRDLVTIIFHEDTRATAPSSYLSSPHPSYWAIQDLTFYVTRYYRKMINLGSGNTYFRMRRSRIISSSYFAQQTLDRNGGGAYGRPIDFGLRDIGPLVYLGSGSYEVVDCDLYASWNLFYSDLGASAAFGLIANNRLRSGNAAHWFDNIRQVIFEHNFHSGNSLVSMGNNVDTYGGGYAQHLYEHGNTYEQVWGNDREVLTYDNAFVCFQGALDSVSGATLATMASIGRGSQCAGSNILGATVLIMNGTGTGQYRRLVSATWDGVRNHFTLNRPFDVDPTVGESHIAVFPFRGRSIYDEVTYRDVGAFQFYGISIENIVSRCMGDRMSAFISWGQYRHSGAPGGGIRYDANPNLLNQFLDNHILEGNNIINYNIVNQHASACLYNSTKFIVAGWDHPPDNQTHNDDHNMWSTMFTILRGNTMDSQGGVKVIGSAKDIIVEGSRSYQTSYAEWQDNSGVTVDATCERVTHRDNLATPLSHQDYLAKQMEQPKTKNQHVPSQNENLQRPQVEIR